MKNKNTSFEIFKYLRKLLRLAAECAPPARWRLRWRSWLGPTIYTKYLRRREGVLLVVAVFLTYLFGLGPSRSDMMETSCPDSNPRPHYYVDLTSGMCLLVFLITFSLARICSFMDSFKHELIQTSKKEVSDYLNHLRITWLILNVDSCMIPSSKANIFVSPFLHETCGNLQQGCPLMVTKVKNRHF